MSNPTLLATGQQAATATAAALPSVVPASPLTGSVRGEGVYVTLSALKANNASVYYGPAGVTTATGKELVAGTTDPPFLVTDLAEVYIVGNGQTVSWRVTNQ